MTDKNRRESFNFRLLETLDDFYDFIEEKGISRSTALRYFIKEGLTETKNEISPECAEDFLQVLFKQKKELAKIGGNLNQIAHYFNIHEHLHESDLRANHEKLQVQLKDVTKVLRDLMNEFRRSTY